MSGIHGVPGGGRRDLTPAQDAFFGEQFARIEAEEAEANRRRPATVKRKPMTGRSRPPRRAAREDTDA